MPDFNRSVYVPHEVERAVGDALDRPHLLAWFEEPHALLDNKTPRELWEAGKREEVLVFIAAAKSGDMA